MKNNGKERPAAVAGRFYPVDPKRLQREVVQYYREAVSKKVANVRAVIVPHAGYVFSGEVAASGFNQLDADASYRRVFIIASSHHVAFDGASLYCDGDYRMPYGVEKVDSAFCRKLVEDHPDIFTDDPEPHLREHAVEVQLPFLHEKLKNDYQIVPIVLGTSDSMTCRKIAIVLKPYLKEENLFVISSDFSHYPDYEHAVAVDAATKDAIIANRPQQLLEVLNKNRKLRIPNLLTSLCGWTSVLTLLFMTADDEQYRYHEVVYRNSGDEKMYGERDEVVGYWAIALSDSSVRDKDDFSLTETDQLFLLQEARRTLDRLLRRHTTVSAMIATDDCSESIYASCGAFVTLTHHERLRGCIGMMMTDEPLVNTVREMAVSAATHDTRFAPVTGKELDELEIEISVLSPLKKIDHISEIELGKHGIYIRRGLSSGVFLPQVAVDTGWNLEQYLGHCARDKAGIGWSGWEKADIYIFTATVFSDQKV